MFSVEYFGSWGRYFKQIFEIAQVFKRQRISCSSISLRMLLNQYFSTKSTEYQHFPTYSTANHLAIEYVGKPKRCFLISDSFSLLISLFFFCFLFNFLVFIIFMFVSFFEESKAIFILC